jgi:predicted unusual protein kinase regulating ubiquinone biosynthesis (AarF/ABC1/UbiB family)
MTKNKPIRRGAVSRGLSLSIASARAGGAFAFDGALRKLRGEEAGNSERLDREAQRFARSLGELKGSYVKIGQLFALLGEHFLPAPLTTALHHLESQAEPLQWHHIEPQLRASLGSRYKELEIEADALAAASLAQVHRARVIATNETVVVKVQYPDLAAMLDEDFDAVVRMLRLARWIPISRDFDSWLATMRTQLHAEIDYPRERALAKTFASALLKYDSLNVEGVSLAVPSVWPRFSGNYWLTMDYVPGFQAGSSEVAALPQHRRNALGRLMLELFFVEVFELGLMQSDPNFGNYLISAEGDQLTLLDFGSVMTLDEPVRQALCDTIVAGHCNDDATLLSGLQRLGCLKDDAGSHAQQTFKTFVVNLLEPLRPPSELPPEFLNQSGEYCWGQSALLNRTGRHVAKSVASRQFTIPSGDFALVARKLTGVFTFIAVLNAEFNAYDVIAPYLKRKAPKKHRTGRRA